MSATCCGQAPHESANGLRVSSAWRDRPASEVGGEKLQAVGKAVQFSWPIRQGKCKRLAQLLRQVG